MCELYNKGRVDATINIRMPSRFCGRVWGRKAGLVFREGDVGTEQRGLPSVFGVLAAGVVNLIRNVELFRIADDTSGPFPLYRIVLHASGTVPQSHGRGQGFRRHNG